MFSFKHTDMKKLAFTLLSFLLVQQVEAQQSACAANFKPDISFYKDGLAWIEPYAWKNVGVSLGSVGGMPVISRQDMEGVLKTSWNSSQRCYDPACIKTLLGVDGWSGSEWSLVLFDQDDYTYMDAVTSTGLSDYNADFTYKYKIDDVKVNFNNGKIAHKELHQQIRKNTIDPAHRRTLKICGS